MKTINHQFHIDSGSSLPNASHRTRGPSMAALALLVSIGVALPEIGCATGAEPESVQLRAYDGKTIFEGIFFGVGPVHHVVAEGLMPDAMPDAEREKMEAYLGENGVTLEEWEQQTEAARGSDAVEADRELLIDWITNEDPTFFPRFGEDMQSGDHFRVDAALDEGIDLLQRASQALAESGQIDAFTLQPSAPDAACGFGPACVVAAVAVGWAAAAVTVVVFAAVAFWSGGSDGEENSLARDRVVDFLASTLGHPSKS